CVATLAPVTTRVEDSVTRSYLADFDEPEGGGDVEMPEDETVEGLPVDLDLGAVMAESLALAIPAYPRAQGANPVAAQISEPGIAPLTDDDVKPFAGLAGLRDQLTEDKDD
ncbi:MAG: YceD family protein, partial [Pseudomonadota bacterium]